MALRKKARKTRTGTGAAAKRKAAPGRTAKAATPRGQAGVIVKDSQRASPQGARKVGGVDRAEMMEVTVTLRGPKLPTADELGARTFSTKSFSARFGASPRDVDKVSQVLRELGLKIVGVSPYTRSMRVSGSIAAMEAVFHPDLAMYKTKDQPSFRDREGTYKVPAPLHGIITAVLGFGERRVAQRKPARVKKKVAHPNSPFTPADIESHYHFPPGDAAGQTIAIAEFGGGYFTSDLTDYCRKFNRPVPKVKTVSIDKVPIRNRAQIARLPVNAKSELDNTGEVMMDVQIVAGLCPGAKLSVYFAKDSQKGWVDLLDQVIREKPAALSISWGAAEDSSGWSKGRCLPISCNQRLVYGRAKRPHFWAEGGGGTRNHGCLRGRRRRLRRHAKHQGRACRLPKFKPVRSCGGRNHDHPQGQEIHRAGMACRQGAARQRARGCDGGRGKHAL